MSTDADVGDDRMRKINVRVPESLLEQIDEETVAALETSRKQAARGETRSLDAVADKYGVDLDES